MGIDRELDREAIAGFFVAQVRARRRRRLDVEIVESGDVKAAPEEAIAYLQELWQVLDSPVEPNATGTADTCWLGGSPILWRWASVPNTRAY